MAVPKKKTSKGRTRRRHKAYLYKQTTKLQKKVQVVSCTNCGEDKLNHFVCKSCGQYNGRQVLDMDKKINKITTVKA